MGIFGEIIDKQKTESKDIATVKLKTLNEKSKITEGMCKLDF